MNITADEIFELMKQRKDGMPKYDPQYHPHKKISERDFFHLLNEIFTDEKIGIDPPEWPALQEYLLEKFCLSVSEAPEKTEVSKAESRRSNFTKDQMRMMLNDAAINERKMPRDARGLERDDEKEHAQNKEGKEIDAPIDSQSELLGNQNVSSISAEAVKKKLAREYLQSINKGAMR
jgi:hypothetical protein